MPGPRDDFSERGSCLIDLSTNLPIIFRLGNVRLIKLRYEKALPSLGKKINLLLLTARCMLRIDILVLTDFLSK